MIQGIVHHRPSTIGRQLFVLLVIGLMLTACDRQAVVPSAPEGTSAGHPEMQTVVNRETWTELHKGGTPWQVDWSKLNINLNNEGEYIAEFGKEPGEERYLTNTPYGVVEEGVNGRLDFFSWQRAYPLQQLPDAGMAVAAAQMNTMLTVQAAGGLPQWDNIGPAPMLGSAMGKQKIDVAGRTRAIAIDPRDSNVVYIGTALGGVWKSTNGGDNWTPLSDKMPSLAIGALALDPANPDIVYAGTGEPTLGLDNYYGAGILKSTDGGQNWLLIGADTFAGMGISKIIVDPTDSNTIYASSARTGNEGASFPSRGVFKSTDGGQSWEGLLGCSDASCNGVTDFGYAATNPPTLFAGAYGYGVFRSTDGGTNWQLLGNGLPDPDQFNIRRIVLDVSPSDPSVVYASMHIGIPNQYDGAVLFKSSDAGQSWAQIPIGPERFNFCGQQCWYSHELAVHPDQSRHRTSRGDGCLRRWRRHTGQSTPYRRTALQQWADPDRSLSKYLPQYHAPSRYACHCL